MRNDLAILLGQYKKQHKEEYETQYFGIYSESIDEEEYAKFYEILGKDIQALETGLLVKDRDSDDKINETAFIPFNKLILITDCY